MEAVASAMSEESGTRQRATVANTTSLTRFFSSSMGMVTRLLKPGTYQLFVRAIKKTKRKEMEEDEHPLRYEICGEVSDTF